MPPKPERQTAPSATQTVSTDFLTFLRRLNQGIGSETGFDYNRDLLTYIQSDIHFVATVEKALEGSGLPTEEQARILEDAAEANHDSELAVMDPSYEFDTDKLSLANDIINAGFNGDSEKLDSLAQTVEDNGGKMPTLDTTAPAVPLLAEPTRPEDAPAVERPIPVGEHNPDALQVTVTDPRMETRTAEEPGSTDYTVARGDNLWKIAQEFYGLEKNADIQKAVETIARANGLSEGANANHIDIGQVLKLPDSPTSEGPDLDWAALDRDSRTGISAKFDVAATGIFAADNIDEAPETPVRNAFRPDALAPAA